MPLCRRNTAPTRKAWGKLVLRVIRSTRPSFLKSLVKTLPRRVKKVIEKRGGPTRW
jgi:hypothetical protein